MACVGMMHRAEGMADELFGPVDLDLSILEETEEWERCAQEGTAVN